MSVPATRPTSASITTDPLPPLRLTQAELPPSGSETAQRLASAAGMSGPGEVLARTVSLSLLLVASGASLAACSDVDMPLDPTPVEPATAYVERGPHGVGHRIAHADELLVKGWYPATEAADVAIEYSFVLKFPGFPADPVSAFGHAVQDATPADGRFPLVVLSHGFGLNPEWYHGLAEHLASHGFVVLAPEHMESDWAPDIVRASITRPAEVSRTIDFALDGPFAAQVDGERVAVAGHSYGGYTALAIAGARFDLDRLGERCADAENPFVQGYFCAPFLDGRDTLAAEMGLDDAPEGLWPTLGDERVDAILALAGDAHLFGERGLAQIDVPVMFMGGTADTGSPWDWATGFSFEHVASADRTLVAFEGSEHFVGVAACDDLPFLAAFPEEMRSYFCEDPAWEKGAELDRVNHFATAFVKHALEDDEQAEAALDGALYDDVEGLSVSVDRRSGAPGMVDGRAGPTDL